LDLPKKSGIFRSRYSSIFRDSGHDLIEDLVQGQSGIGEGRIFVS